MVAVNRTLRDVLRIYDLDEDKLKTACVVGQWKGNEWVGKSRLTGFSRREADVGVKLDSWKIDAVSTQGNLPGWIYEHRAHYDPRKNSICIEAGTIQVISDDGKPDLVPNQHQFEMDLSSLKWKKVN